MGIFKQQTVNLAAARVFNPIADLDNMPEGVYPVQVTGLEPTSNPDVIRIRATVTEGEHRGTEFSDVLSQDFEKPENRSKYLTILLSLGHPAASVQGDMAPQESQFEQRKGNMYFRARIHNPPRADGKSYHQMDFVTPEYAAKWRRNKAAAAQDALDKGLSGEFKANKPGEAPTGNSADAVLNAVSGQKTSADSIPF